MKYYRANSYESFLELPYLIFIKMQVIENEKNKAEKYLSEKK